MGRPGRPGRNGGWLPSWLAARTAGRRAKPAELPFPNESTDEGGSGVTPRNAAVLRCVTRPTARVDIVKTDGRFLFLRATAVISLL